MVKPIFNLYFILIFFNCGSIYTQNLPDGFCYLSSVDSSIKKELRYYSNQNFIGKPIQGYLSDTIIITKKAAARLKKIQTILLKNKLSLKIYDAYRPQKAVNHFVVWAKDLNDTIMKQDYYPNVPKSQLFKLGFIASKSSHTRGSTVDVTLVNLITGLELDMGSRYDFFGVESHPNYSKISNVEKSNRLLLRKVMIENGFKPYENEWWHFTLSEEPFPKTYFNFPVQ